MHDFCDGCNRDIEEGEHCSILKPGIIEDGDATVDLNGPLNRVFCKDCAQSRHIDLWQLLEAETTHT